MKRIILIPAKEADHTTLMLYRDRLKKTLTGAEARKLYNYGSRPQHLHVISDERPQVGEIAWLDWEGKNEPTDYRIGTVMEVSENQIHMTNQFDNESKTSALWPNIRFGKVLESSNPKLGLPIISEEVVKDYINTYNSHAT